MLEKGSFLDCIQNTQKSLLFQGWNKIEKKHLKGCISGNPFSACQTKPKGLSHNLLSNNSFDDDVMMVSTNPTLNGTPHSLPILFSIHKINGTRRGGNSLPAVNHLNRFGMLLDVVKGHIKVSRVINWNS